MESSMYVMHLRLIIPITLLPFFVGTIPLNMDNIYWNNQQYTQVSIKQLRRLE